MDAVSARLDRKGGCLLGASLHRRGSPPRPQLLSWLPLFIAVAAVAAAALGVAAVVNDVAVAAGGGGAFSLRDLLNAPGLGGRA